MGRPRVSHFHLGRVLRRRDPLLDERVPVVTVRALPEQLGAAVPASHADVRIEIEDRVARELAVAVDEGWLVASLLWGFRLPSCSDLS